MKFTDVNGEYCTIDESTDQLDWISNLLECNQFEIASALTSCSISSRDEVFQMKENTSRAYHGRDTLSKVSLIFSRQKID